MRKVLLFQLFVFAWGLIVMLSWINSTFRPNIVFSTIGILGWFSLPGGFLVTLVFGFTRRQNFIYRWMILPLFCLMTIVGSVLKPGVGLLIRDLEFKARINDYESVVNDIRDGKISFANGGEIDMSSAKKLPPTVVHVGAFRCDDNGVVVIFVTGSLGDSRKGLVFYDVGNKGHCKDKISKNFILTPILKNWFSFSDKPREYEKI